MTDQMKLPELIQEMEETPKQTKKDVKLNFIRFDQEQINLIFAKLPPNILQGTLVVTVALNK